MRVYHFRDSHYGVKSIKEKQLKISRIMELNDPFEFLGVRLDNPEFRAALTATKRQLSSNRGILCFCRGWKNPVQWSHYADNHTGVCLGFDIPRELLAKIKYVKKRINHNGTIDLSLMDKILTTKFTHWRYEREYRLFISLDINEEKDGKYYSTFSSDLKLKQVIVGSRSNLTRKDINDALGPQIHEVEVFKSRPAFKTYKIVRNKKEEMWK